MRVASAVIAICLLPLAGACTTTRSDGSGKIQTSSEANQENLQGAVAAPLRDVNVLRTEIPEILLDAAVDPYARPQPVTCRQIFLLVRPLDEALGQDIDAPVVADASSMEQGRDTALGAVASFASDAVPFRGWVRKLSGAERHDQRVQNAILAGAVRRAYLKGLGESHGCAPPATPSHILTEALRNAPPPPPSPTPEPPVEAPPGKPRYPVR